MGVVSTDAGTSAVLILSLDEHLVLDLDEDRVLSPQPVVVVADTASSCSLADSDATPDRDDLLLVDRDDGLDTGLEDDAEEDLLRLAEVCVRI